MAAAEKKKEEGGGDIKTQLLQAILSHDVAAASAAFAKAATPSVDYFNVTLGDEYTALQVAVANEDVAMVKWLLTKKANPNLNLNRQPMPLRMALRQSAFELIRVLLVDGGADPFQFFSVCEDGKRLSEAPPIWACLNENLMVGLQEILQFAESQGRLAEFVNFRHPQDDEPLLHCAVARQNTAAVMMLLEKKANVNLATDDGGSTPLHAAAFCGNLDLISLLLRHGADVDRQTTSPRVEFPWQLLRDMQKSRYALVRLTPPGSAAAVAFHSFSAITKFPLCRPNPVSPPLPTTSDDDEEEETMESLKMSALFLRSLLV